MFAGNFLYLLINDEDDYIIKLDGFSGDIALAKKINVLAEFSAFNVVST
jgi:hypothetical protein